MLRLAAARGGIEFSTELATRWRKRRDLHRGGNAAAANGEANLSYLESAAHSIGAAMDGSRFRVVVNKSTVPVGCGNLVEALVREGIRETRPEGRRTIRFGVASNPEFLREGCAIADSLYPDRIVVGAEAETSKSCDSCTPARLAAVRAAAPAFPAPRA